ncbi:hypothetical protein [Bradyrhizobium hipponense]|uniref:hypothetical protein n=1 Tax=Bradyrhizobium hipponense TaxID=2605638 RepID=UPI0016531466|nr:hypothetical protein [Bradyrhizobium hipponense]
MIIESLTQQIVSLPPNEDTTAALNFLKRADLMQVASVTGTSNHASAEFWRQLLKKKA